MGRGTMQREDPVWKPRGGQEDKVQCTGLRERRAEKGKTWAGHAGCPGAHSGFQILCAMLWPTGVKKKKKNALWGQINWSSYFHVPKGRLPLPSSSHQQPLSISALDSLLRFPITLLPVTTPESLFFPVQNAEKGYLIGPVYYLHSCSGRALYTRPCYTSMVSL